MGNPNLTALASGDATFNATTGVMAVTLQASETLVEVSLRASDSAILLNGAPVLDTTGASLAGAKTLKRLNLTIGADNTTVIFDYYNGIFNPGIKPVGTAAFGTAGTLVTFGAHTGGAFKVRGTSGADTFAVGQDTTGMSPNVLISLTEAQPDIEISATTMPSLGFNLGVGNDSFDAFSAKGGTLHSLSFPVSVHGGVGNDTLIGGLAADTLYGDEGINTIDESLLYSSHVADSLYGLTTPPSVSGTNSTTVTYATWGAGAASGVVVNGVNVQIAHLATALINGVTDNVDDSVGAVIGSPKNDTISCSQLTDMPCYVQGMAGDDTLSPGLSSVNTHYLYGGDGNDTFVMTQVANHVQLVGGNIGDISTVKNSYVDTVDYSAAISALSALSTTISMNAVAPTTCAVATSTTTPPCAVSGVVGTADSTQSGFAGAAHTNIRNDITVAKCPTGVHSAGVVCTVIGNNAGDTIYSGWGADVLTGGTGDDNFVLADFNPAAAYVAGTHTKVISGGPSGGSGGADGGSGSTSTGNDTVDFSLHTGATTIRLDCTASTCANSGSPYALTAADKSSATTATAAALAETALVTTLTTDYAALSPAVAADTAVKNAAVAADTAAQAAATALAAAVANTDAATVAALTAAATAATTAAAASVAANTADTTGDSGVLADAVAVATSATSIAAAASAFAPVSEGISLVNINNAVCPASGTTACAVTTNTGADLIDFNGDGAVAGSSLTCNSSDVTVAHATGLANNCGI